MRRTPLIIGSSAVAVAGLVAGTTAYASMQKSVTLSVDGAPRTVSTFAGTVGDVLSAEGVSLGGHDTVSPAVGTPVSDGSEIAVQYGRKLTLIVDGKPRDVWVTARSVNAALGELGLRVENARMSASRSTGIGREGLSLRIDTAKHVRLLLDGKPHPFTTTGLTVADALRALRVTVATRDHVSPTRNAKLVDGARVVVNRVHEQTVRRSASVPYRTVRHSTSNLYEGRTSVTQQGRDGTLVKTYVLTYVGRHRQDTRLAGTQVTRRPVSEVVYVGTKPRPKPKPQPQPAPTQSQSQQSASNQQRSSSSSQSPQSNVNGGVWDRIAQCESGGDWSINTGNGYYGGLQFSLSTWRSLGGGGLPSQASKSEQIRLAIKLRDSVGGYGPWPACSARLGLR